MTLKLDDKKAVVADVAVIAKQAISAVVVDYKGLTVAEVTELRQKARKSSVYLKVVKNTLLKKALKDTDFECMSDALTGQVFVAFSMQEPCAAARVIRDYLKGHEALTVKEVALGGKVLGAASLKAVADLPNKEQALSMLMSVMLAPVTKFVRTLAEPYAKLTRTFKALSEK